MQEEQKQEESEAEAAEQDAVNVNPTNPNIIGNVEDYPNVQLAEQEETPVLGAADVQMEHQLEEEGSKYKDITGHLKRSKRN